MNVPGMPGTGYTMTVWESLQQGLILWLPLETDHLDHSVYNRDVSVVNGVMSYSAEHPHGSGSSAFFPGSYTDEPWPGVWDGGVRLWVPQMPRLSFPFAVSFWVKSNLPQDVAYEMTLMTQYNAPIYPDLYSNTSHLTIHYTLGTYQDDLRFGALQPYLNDFQRDAWNHVVLNFTNEDRTDSNGNPGKSVQVYLNDVHTITPMIRTADWNALAPLWVGGVGVSGAGAAANLLHVRFYNRLLTEIEISHLNQIPSGQGHILPHGADIEFCPAPLGTVGPGVDVETSGILTARQSTVLAAAQSVENYPPVLICDSANRPPVTADIERGFQPRVRWTPVAGDFVRRPVFRCRIQAPFFAEIILPLIAFQARLRNGSPNYIAVTIADPELYKQAIYDRTYGTLHVDGGEEMFSGAIQWSTLVVGNVSSFRYSRDAVNSTGTVIAYRQETFRDVHTVTVEGITMENVSEYGKRSIRCALNFGLRPGHLVTYGDGNQFAVGEISYRMSGTDAYMHVIEE